MRGLACLLLLVSAVVLGDSCHATELRGEIVDADTGKPIAARVYIEDSSGSPYFPRSAAADGRAVPYQKVRQGSSENHTSLSAHPFVIDLPAGEYDITVERGKEYFTASRQVSIAVEPVSVRLELTRFVDMSERGWYSGETHVHRELEELPLLVLAEDLSVAFPLLYWETEAFKAPRGSPAADLAGADLIRVDGTHVIYPRNTEYEIFTVGGRSHTLGAIFILGHRSVFDRGVPPLVPVIEQARREGALLELDKHNWPWSMALVPLLDVDLFELANNHHWRAPFTFRTFGEQPPEFMNVERDAAGMTEDGWTQVGFENYYALLDSGFRMRPTGGSASGVHPVPLGFGRVYVQLGDDFSYESWLRGLNEGRSFVTTGPMLFVRVDGRHPGQVFKQDDGALADHTVEIEALSPHPIDRVEIVVNGEVVRRTRETERDARGAYSVRFEERITIDRSSWLVARCYATVPPRSGETRGRTRFAHSAPFHFEVPGKPLRPRREQIDYLIRRVEEQIERSRGVLPDAALAEYRRALAIYREIAGRAR